LGLIVAGAATNFPNQDLGEDWTAQRAAETLLVAAPENGVVYSYWDEPTFALWFSQRVRRTHRQVAVVDLRLIALPWYLGQIGAR